MDLAAPDLARAAVTDQAAAVAPPRPATRTLGWTDTNNPPSTTYNVYATADLKTWIILTNTPEKIVTFAAPAPAQFYCVSATNQNGESPHPAH